VDMNNAVEAEVAVATRCSTTTRTLTTTMIDRIAAATHHISSRSTRHTSLVHISLSRDMGVTIRALDPHQTMGEQPIPILLLAEVPLLEAGHHRARNIIHTAPVEAEVAVMDRATAVLEEIMVAMEATKDTVVDED